MAMLLLTQPSLKKILILKQTMFRIKHKVARDSFNIVNIFVNLRVAVLEGL